jgi:hypothetical protein
MDIYGDAPAVVFYGYIAIGVEDHLNVVAIACHGLVNGVINHFKDEVVKAFYADVPNVHGGAFAYSL